MPEPSIPQVSIVGSESLLGADLRDLLRASILGTRLKLLGTAEPGTAILSAEEDEPVVIAPIDEEDLNASRIVFLTGSPEVNQKAFSRVRPGPATPVVIDLTRSLEDHPAARLRAPMAEKAAARQATNSTSSLSGAILIATVYAPVRRARSAAVICWKPANAAWPVWKNCGSRPSRTQFRRKQRSRRALASTCWRDWRRGALSLQSIQEVERHLASLLGDPCRSHAEPPPAANGRDAHYAGVAVGVVADARHGRRRAALNHEPFDFRGEVHTTQSGWHGGTDRHRWGTGG
jgi:hypothetical protein